MITILTIVLSVIALCVSLVALGINIWVAVRLCRDYKNTEKVLECIRKRQ